MGATYAPSVANIKKKKKWEQEEIFGNIWPGLALYQRFINYIVMLWKGSKGELDNFTQHINSNRCAIKFTVNIERESVNFLDLVIFKSQKALCTKTCFKSTDRNGYIPLTSCHHPKWKMAIPKGQFTRIKRNCDLIKDFID